MIKLIVDSTADLQPGWLAKHPEVTVVSTPVLANSKYGYREFYDLTSNDFQMIHSKYFCQGYNITTSSPLVMDFDYEFDFSVMSIAKQALNEGYAVVYLAMGSGMSSTYQYVYTCFEFMREEMLIPEHQLQVVDTRCMSTGTALLVRELYERFDLQDLKEVTPIVEYVEENRDQIVHFFTWTNLDYIVKSGRVSTIKGLTAKLFKLIPIGMAVYTKSDERKLEIVSGINSPRTIEDFARVIAKYARRHICSPKSPITIAYGNNPESAARIESVLKDDLPQATIIGGYRLGSAIQAHGGPTSLHVNFHANNSPWLRSTTAEIADILAEIRK